MSQIVHSFLDHCREEAPALHSALGRLNENGDKAFEHFLKRFDRDKNGVLSNRERLDATKLLGYLREPTEDSLGELNKVLDYLDFNANSTLEANEIAVISEIFDLFSKADSNNSSLSTRELSMLYAVLRHLDGNNNGRLDKDERRKLKASLAKPQDFLAKQKEENPLLKALL